MLSISVAMTTYNGARFLRDQLESIASQSRLPDELIVCDDQSQDGSVAILRDFAESAPFPVRIEVNPENLGYVRNFCKCVSLCTGDLVFLCDQDDLWKPEKVERLAAPATENAGRPLLVFSDAELIDDHGDKTDDSLWKLLKMPPIGHDFEELRYRNLVTGATCAINRELIDTLATRTIPVHLPHDYSFALLAWTAGYIIPIEEKLTSYRIHSNNQIGVIRNPGDILRIALKCATNDYNFTEQVRCSEIAHFITAFDTNKSRYFWRKAAYFRMVRQSTLCTFTFINRRYYSELFRNRDTLVRAFLSRFFRRSATLNAKPN